MFTPRLRRGEKYTVPKALPLKPGCEYGPNFACEIEWRAQLATLFFVDVDPVSHAKLARPGPGRAGLLDRVGLFGKRWNAG